MANPIIDLLGQRHASRAIDTKPLPEPVIAEIAEAARLTPSCYNKQPWRFLFLTSEEGLENITASGGTFFVLMDMRDGSFVEKPRAKDILASYGA